MEMSRYGSVEEICVSDRRGPIVSHQALLSLSTPHTSHPILQARRLAEAAAAVNEMLYKANVTMTKVWIWSVEVIGSTGVLVSFLI